MQKSDESVHDYYNWFQIIFKEKSGLLPDVDSMWVAFNSVYQLAKPGSLGFPGGSVSKEFACKAGDLGSISGLERSPGGRHGNPPHYSCLENPMDRGAWQAIVREVAESDMTEWLSTAESGPARRVFSSFPGLHPVDASSTAQPWQPQPGMSLDLARGPLAESHCCKG